MLSSNRFVLIRGELVSSINCDGDDFCHFFEFVVESLIEFTEFLIQNWPLSKILVEIVRSLRFYKLLPILM